MNTYAVLASFGIATFFTIVIVDWLRQKQKITKYKLYVAKSIMVMDDARRSLIEAKKVLKEAKEADDAQRQQPKD